MNVKDFQSSDTGRAVLQPTGYYAFIPEKLPRSFDLAPLADIHSVAERWLGELSGLSRHFHSVELLVRPYANREAVGSTRIEGTQSGLTELYLDELEESEKPTNDVEEVRNYLRALRIGLERIKVMPITGRLLRELHAILLAGVRGQERMPGEFRRSQNWIGGSNPVNATFVPPPMDHMLDALSDWEDFVNRKSELPDLIRCGLMHERIETIHPFLDGNGRIGRLLIPLFLIERKRLSQPLLYISAYIEQSKSTYYDLLKRVRTHGDSIAWLRYFLEAIAVSAKDAVQDTDRLISLRKTLRATPSLTRRHQAIALIDHLFLNPYTTIARASELLGVSKPTAKVAIMQLVDAGLLTPLVERAWGQIWRSNPILAAVSRATPFASAGA